MKSHRRIVWSSLAALAIFLLPQLSTSAQGGIDELAITAIDEADFPQVTFTFRAIDRDGQTVTGVSSGDLRVTENDQAMPIESLEEIADGAWIHIVIDAGASMSGDRWINARDTLLDYLQSGQGMEDGLDHVALSVVEANGLRSLADFTTSSAQLVSALERYTPPGGTAYTAPLQSLVEVLSQLSVNAEAGALAKDVILVTAGLESFSGTDALNQRIESTGIPIHTILARTAPRIPCPAPVTNSDGSVSQPACDENVRDLAIASGGQYAHYADSDNLNRLYTRLANDRRQYQLSYRSNQGDSGTRQVALITPASGSPAATASTSFTVEINPIRVLIDSPSPGESIVREAAAFTEDRGSIPPTSYTVVASPVFPDIRRRIVQAELLVNGSVVSQVDFPGETIELPWNLRNITQLGVNEQTVQVRIQDELGLESISQPSNVKVEVVVPPQPTVMVPEMLATLIPEMIVITPTPVPCTLPDALCPAERAMRGNWLAATSMGIALLALTFAGVVWVNRDKAPVRAATASITRAVERITKPQGRSKALAHLKILAGEENLNRLLAIHGDTRLGRSRRDADLLFRQDDENPVISRIHCTIKDMETHFEIVDEGSTHGTYLNGSKLQPLVAEPLNHEDEIELGLVEAGGVKLQFLLAEEEAMGDELRQTKRTRKETPSQDGGSNDEVPF